MVSHILHLKIETQFGQIDNPLWQVATLTKPIDKSRLKMNPDPWINRLIPHENWNIEIQDSKVIFQSFISEENLNNPILIEKLNSSHRVQIWIDKLVNEKEASLLQDLLLRYENLDLVYLPDLHMHPVEVFKHLKSIPRLLVQMHLKKNSFDRWLSPIELWERICWLNKSSLIQILGFQVLDTQLNEQRSKTEELFLLYPSFENLENHLKLADKSQYYLQSLTHSFVKVAGKNQTFILREMCWVFINPTKARWLNLYHSLSWYLVKRHIQPLIWWNWRNVKNYAIFYPFRKVYWFFAFQFKKRILGKVNESSQRRNTSYKLRS